MGLGRSKLARRSAKPSSGQNGTIATESDLHSNHEFNSCCCLKAQKPGANNNSKWVEDEFKTTPPNRLLSLLCLDCTDLTPINPNSHLKRIVQRRHKKTTEATKSTILRSAVQFWWTTGKTSLRKRSAWRQPKALDQPALFLTRRTRWQTKTRLTTTWASNHKRFSGK